MADGWKPSHANSPAMRGGTASTDGSLSPPSTIRRTLTAHRTVAAPLAAGVRQ